MTIQALRALKPEPYCDLVEVPPGQVRTKPKACNYALRFAKGTYVTIYDAEDVPDRGQLRLAASLFAQHEVQDDATPLCLQGRLNYYNRSQNLLTKLFSLEYGIWFHALLPGLHRLSMPIPLGGTSNHLSRKTLEALQAWDPHNVTEDADLGFRIAMQGGKTQMLPSTTLEEAPHTLNGWLKQRARWLKGYMQTYRVYMRRPVEVLEQLGWRGFLGFQLFIGGPVLAYLSIPPMLALTLIWQLGWHPVPGHSSWPLLIAFGYGCLAFGLCLHLWQAVWISRQQGWQAMGGATLSYPFYWLLHALASYMGMLSLITRPYYWAKTQHGHGISFLQRHFAK